MTARWRLEDVAALSEGFDVECKAAKGRDGRGELPEDFWKSYSAMANGEGGVIWLGIQEKPVGTFTVLGLADVEKVPAQAVAEIATHLGERFSQLPELARLAMITAQSEGLVHHARLREMSTEHSSDITKLLVGLVRDGLLISHGTGRGTVYFLPWQQPNPGNLLEAGNALPTPQRAALPPELGSLPPELSAVPRALTEVSPRSEAGPLLLEWSAAGAEIQGHLTKLAEPVSRRDRVAPKWHQK